jgi:hypothetical protein
LKEPLPTALAGACAEPGTVVPIDWNAKAPEVVRVYDQMNKSFVVRESHVDNTERAVKIAAAEKAAQELRDMARVGIGAIGVATLPPHMQRVEGELAELRERLAKLCAFIGAPAFDSVPAAERARMLRQASLQAQLASVLDERIAAARAKL